jgi:hypothetical protein
VEESGAVADFRLRHRVSLWIAARFLLKAFSGVIKSFDSLGRANVHELRSDFDYYKVGFFVGIGFFCLAAFIRAASPTKTHQAGGKGVRWLETSGWILSVLAFLYVSLACLRIDRLFSGSHMSQVDPSQLAKGILHILSSLSVWAVLSFAIGIVIIISASIARPVLERSK